MSLFFHFLWVIVSCCPYLWVSLNNRPTAKELCQGKHLSEKRCSVKVCEHSKEDARRSEGFKEVVRMGDVLG